MKLTLSALLFLAMLPSTNAAPPSSIEQAQARLAAPMVAKAPVHRERAPVAWSARERHAWKGRDTLFEGILAGLVVVDGFQTQWGSRQPGVEELNPLFGGPHPGDRRIWATMGTGFALHAGIAALLPQPYRGWWQWVGIGSEGATVLSNLAVQARF